MTELGHGRVARPGASHLLGIGLLRLDRVRYVPRMIDEASDALARIDVERVRAETSGVDHRIHVNNAGASPPPDVVLDAVIDYLRAEARDGGYETAAARQVDLDRTYGEASLMLGCEQDEVAFQQNASQAWWAAFNSIPLASGDRILATSAEYVSSGIALVRAAERGIDVDLIPDDEDGQTSVAALEGMLDERVKLVCATHMPTSGGLINPVEEIGAAVKEGSDALYLVDVCQSFGQVPLDVGAMQADFAAMTGRKFCRAPRGTGLLFQRSGLSGLQPPRATDGWGTEWAAPWSIEPKPGARGHELYESGFAAKVGLGVALGYANELGLDNIGARVGALASYLRRQLETIDGVAVSDRGVHKSGIVTFSVDGVSTEKVKDHLTDRGINSSLAKVVAAQFDMAERAPDGLVRLSVHYFNTTDEIDRVSTAVAEIAS